MDGMDAQQGCVAKALGACACCGRFDCEEEGGPSLKSRLRSKLKDRRRALEQCGQRCKEDGNPLCLTYNNSEAEDLDALISWINNGDEQKEPKKKKKKKKKKTLPAQKDETSSTSDAPSTATSGCSQYHHSKCKYKSFSTFFTEKAFEQQAANAKKCVLRAHQIEGELPDARRRVTELAEELAREKARVAELERELNEATLGIVGSVYEDADAEVEAFRLQCDSTARCGCRVQLTPQVSAMIVDMCTTEERARRS